jgi:hypothetical protein
MIAIEPRSAKCPALGVVVAVIQALCYRNPSNREELKMRACVIILLLSACVAHADRGMIPFRANVQLYEPNQRALIAWNGVEEILVLSTDVYASEPTKVLHILPCPSEPAFKAADPGVFNTATRFLNEHWRKQGHTRGPAFQPGAPTRAVESAGEVIKQEIIGSHNISVTRVTDATGFCNWAEEYLASLGAEAPKINPRMRSAIEGYISRGMQYFVYDVVELGKTLKTNEPIQYSFKSSSLFYPLVLTHTNDKSVYINLLILTSQATSVFPELPIKNIVGEIQFPLAGMVPEAMPCILSPKQLQELGPDLNQLFRGKETVVLREWYIQPEYGSSFYHDLVAR